MRHYNQFYQYKNSQIDSSVDGCLNNAIHHAVDIPLWTPKQVYAIEKAWFAEGNPSYGLMQQAAWQIAQWVRLNMVGRSLLSKNMHVLVWVGSGNNGGDGWLVASYLKQLGAVVTVIEVAQSTTTDAKRAKQDAQQQGVGVMAFSGDDEQMDSLRADVCIDALFGIGLNRKPKDGEAHYAAAIGCINELRSSLGHQLTVVSIDVPSGLVASTGQVFEGCAVKADVTLCLIARKVGLHIKDAPDYSGRVVDIPLIPTVLSDKPSAYLLRSAQPIARRENNSHKGSFGHALIIGGNQVDGSQGMGGAAILSASMAFAVGVGKLSVACHAAFHGSLITSIPNAMSIDLHDCEGVVALIEQCDCVAIGMGLGRDAKRLALFQTYLKAAVEADVDLVIDADGLYHLATVYESDKALIEQLIQHAAKHEVWYTPHSGEAGRLLDMTASDVEADRFGALKQLAEKYQGSWLLKGAGSMILEEGEMYVCDAGNPGMATAGMGDVLSGLATGLLAQAGMPKSVRRLRQAVMIHALAGDKKSQEVGVWALQANDMPEAVGQVMNELTYTR